MVTTCTCYLPNTDYCIASKWCDPIKQYNMFNGYNSEGNGKISRVFDGRLWIQILCSSTDGM